MPKPAADQTVQATWAMIKAAPDLLAALKAVRTVYPLEGRVLEIVRAAIDKAEGKS